MKPIREYLMSLPEGVREKALATKVVHEEVSGMYDAVAGILWLSPTRAYWYSVYDHYYLREYQPSRKPPELPT